MKYANRVLQTTTSTGVGDLALTGDVVGFQSFSAAFLDGTDKFAYCIDAGASFEIGIGHLNAGALVRETLIESSTGAKLNLAAGDKKVFCTVPAQRTLDYMWDKITRLQIVSAADSLETAVIADGDSAASLDMSLARCFLVTFAGSARPLALTIANVPVVAASKQEITIYVKNLAAWTTPFQVTMPTGWKWGRDFGGATNTGPASIANGTTAAFTGTTLDGGATWLGSVLGRGW